MAPRIEGNLLVLKERSIAPSTPPSGYSLIYANTSDLFRQIDDTGTDRPLTSNLDIQDVEAGVSVTNVAIIQGWNQYAEIVGSWDTLFEFLPWFVDRPFCMFDPGSINVRMFGNHVLFTGTTVTSGVTDLTAIFRRFTTTTTPSVNAGITSSGNTAYRFYWMDTSCKAIFYAKIKTGSTTNVGYTIGLGSANILLNNILSDQGVYFRYSTSAGDPGWVFVVHASSSERTVTGNLGNIQSGTMYEMYFYFTDDGIYYSFDGSDPVLVAYPAGFGGLGVGPQITIMTQDTNIKVLEIFEHYLETN